VKSSCSSSEFLFKALEINCSVSSRADSLWFAWSPRSSCPALPPLPPQIPIGFHGCLWVSMGLYGSPVLLPCPLVPPAQAGQEVLSTVPIFLLGLVTTFLKPEKMQHLGSTAATPNLEQHWQIGSKPIRRSAVGRRTGWGGGLSCLAQHTGGPPRPEAAATLHLQNAVQPFPSIVLPPPRARMPRRIPIPAQRGGLGSPL